MSLSRATVNGTKFSEPYRATKLWLEAVAIFRRGVPLGKNRRQWRTYDNCFVAQDAITWFQSQLQIAFDPSISRKQTWTLLQKFYKANIITEVTNTRPNLAASPPYVNETEFKDNGHLYKLVCTESPYATHKSSTGSKSTPKQAKLATPKNELPKSTSKYSVVIKPLTKDQIDAIWEQVFIDKFIKIVGCDVFTSFFKGGIIKGSVISFNLMQTGPHNIVLSTSKDDDLPHWLVSAMKCLANWPNNHTQESGVPNYPGFEGDVYKLISDYFTKFQKKGPLLTYDLYDAFVTTFIRAELFDFNSRLYSAKISNAARSRMFQLQHTAFGQPTGAMTPHSSLPFAAHSPMFKMEDQYPFNASESVENLILDILTPATHRQRNRNSRNVNLNPNGNRIGENFGSNLNPRKNLFNPQRGMVSAPSGNKNNENLPENKCMHSASDSVLTTTSVTSVPQPMASQNYDASRYTHPLYYETAFTGNETPITRVVSHTELKASLGNKSENHSRTKVRPPAFSADAVLDGYSTYAYENPILDLSASDMINHPKYSRILQTTDLQSNAAASASNNLSLSSNSFCNYSDSAGGTTSTSGYETCGMQTENRASNSLLDDKFMGKPLRAFSAVNLSDAAKVRDRQLYACSTLPGSNGLKKSNNCGSTPKSLVAEYANSPRLMTSEGKCLAVLSFRMLTLLLPPVNRRHLQILLRFMSKTSRNDKLMLDVATSTRAIIINTFFRLILRSEDPAEYDELLALRIVTFIMDNDHEIFAGGEDTDIVLGAQEKISQQQIIKVPTAVATTPKVPKGGPKLTSPNSGLKEGPNKVDLSPVLSENFVFMEANKENSGNPQFCSRITMNEYDDQRLLSGTAQSLRDLLDSWCNNDNMEPKEKRKQILKFKDEYPHIFWEKFGYDELPSFLNESKTKARKEKKTWNVFKALRL